LKLGILLLSTLLSLKGELKVEVEVEAAPSDWYRRWTVCEATGEVVARRAAPLEVWEGERLCRVKVRSAAPAEDGAGRMSTTSERRESVAWEMGA
jgi:hypothetical protein